MRFLVLGGAGFIGSNFVKYALKKYKCQILILDKLTYSGNLDNLAEFNLRECAPNVYVSDNANLQLVVGDVANKEDVESTFKFFMPDYVINFAAETHVDRSIHVGSEKFIDTNVKGVFNILEAVKRFGCKKFVEVSTDEVYGQLPNPYDTKKEETGKFDESYPFKPNVAYSATKASGDCLCNAYYHTWGVPVVVTHCSNNYGPFQYPEKVIPYWMSRIIEGKPIPVYGDGMNIRDWIHVTDHIKALLLCLFDGKSGETYNIGADNERTNIEIANLIAKALGKKIKLEFVKDRPGHDRRYAIDSTKIKKELKWKPKYGRAEFFDKLKETVKWYLNHKQWVADVIKKTGVVNAHIDLWRGSMKL